MDEEEQIDAWLKWYVPKVNRIKGELETLLSEAKQEENALCVGDIDNIEVILKSVYLPKWAMVEELWDSRVQYIKNIAENHSYYKENAKGREIMLKIFNYLKMNESILYPWKKEEERISKQKLSLNPENG